MITVREGEIIRVFINQSVDLRRFSPQVVPQTKEQLFQQSARDEAVLTHQ